MEYRSELKYLVSDTDLEILKYRLTNVMKLDPNIKQEGFYNIRSIYFDDIDNSCYHENDAGIDERLKIRMRIYDKSDDIIKLEIKFKKSGMTKKETCTISRSLCERLIRGEHLMTLECTNKVLNRIFIEQKLRYLSPKIIVEYDRTAWVSPIGNVRVTFDRNIRASKYVDRFFSDNTFAVPILDGNLNVLEVKYDELIPDFIADSIELNSLSQTALSKYYLSRQQFKEEVV